MLRQCAGELIEILQYLRSGAKVFIAKEHTNVIQYVGYPSQHFRTGTQQGSNAHVSRPYDRVILPNRCRNLTMLAGFPGKIYEGNTSDSLISQAGIGASIDGRRGGDLDPDFYRRVRRAE